MKRAFVNKAPIVRLQGQAVLIFNDPDQSLLEALEIKKVRIFSECRSGYCGCCKTKIKSGSVIYQKEPLVPLADDECLPCCCAPNSDVDLELSAKGADVFISPLTINSSFHQTKQEPAAQESTSPCQLKQQKTKLSALQLELQEQL